MSYEGHFKTGNYLDVAWPSLAALSQVYSENQGLEEAVHKSLKSPEFWLEKELA